MIKTIVAVFDHFTDARRATVDLIAAGYDREDISLVASKTARDTSVAAEHIGGDHAPDVDVHDPAITGASVGAAVGGVSGLLVGIAALAIPGIGPIIALGPLTGALAGAGVGAATGGLIGALIDLGVPHAHAKTYAEAVKRGGTLLTVRTPEERADRAMELIEKYHPIDVAEREAQWRVEDAGAAAPQATAPVARTERASAAPRATSAGATDATAAELRAGRQAVDMDEPDAELARHIAGLPPANDVGVTQGAAWDSAAPHDEAGEANVTETASADGERVVIRRQRVIIVGEPTPPRRR